MRESQSFAPCPPARGATRHSGYVIGKQEAMPSTRGQRAGSQEALADEFAAVYEAHAMVVFAYLRGRLRDSDRAAELTSETFAEALANWRTFDRARGPVRAWLFGIANNVLAMTMRSGHRERRARDRLGIPSVDASPAELAELEERLDAERLGHTLTSLVADLPADERSAVLARVVDELEYADIAQQVGASQATVRQRVSRGLRRLSGGLEGRNP
jgi:RNA polymerase sigma factor (sigma-70 family)